MSPAMPATLREVRRGDEPHEVLLGYGLTVDEQIRTREAALKLLGDLVSPQ